jgi:hypothetical protein
VAGPVIHATGRSEFKDGLGSGDLVSGYSYHMSVHTGLPDHTMNECRPYSKANGLAMFAIFEYRS